MEIEVDENGFPILMKSLIDGMVVLFESENCGTVMSLGESVDDLKIGYASNAFISCSRKDIWEKYEGEITLKNK